MLRITRGINIEHVPLFTPRVLHLPDGTPVPLHEYDERLAEYEAAHPAAENTAGAEQE
jgi:hypothetical protein